MNIVIIIFIILGIGFIIGSFMIQDKLSIKDLNKISELSESEMKIIVDKQMSKASTIVEEKIEDAIDESVEATKRSMEKETNDKIMAISEFSDTILESMNKTHNEIMFLYSMLNDKHVELTEHAGHLQRFSDDLKKTENELLNKIADHATAIEDSVGNSKIVDENELLVASVKLNETENETINIEELEFNHNESILSLHKEGKTDVEIAKELGLGLGEVKLVIGLYKGEQ